MGPFSFLLCGTFNGVFVCCCQRSESDVAFAQFLILLVLPPTPMSRRRSSWHLNGWWLYCYSLIGKGESQRASDRRRTPSMMMMMAGEFSISIPIPLAVLLVIRLAPYQFHPPGRDQSVFLWFFCAIVLRDEHPYMRLCWTGARKLKITSGFR